MAAWTGVWFACARSVTPFDTDHQTRLTQTGGNRVIISEEVRNGQNSEVEVAQWAAGDSARPRMIPGQTRSNDGIMLMYAHKEPPAGMEAQRAGESYVRIRSAPPAINGVEGFLVYHEWGSEFPRLTPVMNELTIRFNADRGHDPELWAVDDRNKSMEWGLFYDTLWGFSNNTIFMSERYNWKASLTPIERIQVFEIGERNGQQPIGGIITTAEDARNERSAHTGRACRWTALVAAHTDNHPDRQYYTPSLTELRFTSLLPVGLGAQGIIYCGRRSRKYSHSTLG